MDITDALARQCAVILPAVSVVIAAQISGVHSKIKAQREEASKAVAAAKEIGHKYAAGSPKAELIQRTDRDRIGWGIIGVVAYLYAACAIAAEVACLIWMGSDPATQSSQFKGVAPIIIGTTLAGVVFVVFIPAARLIESVSSGHKRASRDKRDYDNLEEHPESTNATRMDF